MNRIPYRSWTGLEEEEWLAGHMSLFDSETGAIDTVASYDHWPGNPPGLPANPIKAVGEVTVATGQFVYTRSDRPEITWRLPDGTVTRIVRWRAEPTRLTEELLEPVEAYERMMTQINTRGIPMSRIEEMTQIGMSWYYAMIGKADAAFRFSVRRRRRKRMATLLPDGLPGRGVAVHRHFLGRGVAGQG